MPLSEAILWFVAFTIFIAFVVSGIAVMVVMLVEVVSEDIRRFKTWLKPGPKPPQTFKCEVL